MGVLLSDFTQTEGRNVYSTYPLFFQYRESILVRYAEKKEEIDQNRKYSDHPETGFLVLSCFINTRHLLCETSTSTLFRHLDPSRNSLSLVVLECMVR